MRAITASRAEGQSIGELSRATGVNIETIRYYERIKMLPSPRRTEGGHRVYGPVEMRSLAFIRSARELGFTLDEIARCSTSVGPERLHAETFATSLHTTSNTSAPRSPIL